ncbi:hypothetical protein F4780DRAFT_707959 [Xylariomycetidae sp. FL0641]|nr:hypothetical protein F4780DRAFT_707959 [Xylariomycetidae sp. FL0641]
MKYIRCLVTGRSVRCCSLYHPSITGYNQNPQLLSMPASMNIVIAVYFPSGTAILTKKKTYFLAIVSFYSAVRRTSKCSRETYISRSAVVPCEDCIGLTKIQYVLGRLPPPPKATPTVVFHQARLLSNVSSCRQKVVRRLCHKLVRHIARGKRPQLAIVGRYSSLSAFERCLFPSFIKLELRCLSKPAYVCSGSRIMYNRYSPVASSCRIASDDTRLPS